jgi:hypothetical protein
MHALFAALVEWNVRAESKNSLNQYRRRSTRCLLRREQLKRNKGSLAACDRLFLVAASARCTLGIGLASAPREQERECR